MHFLIRQAWGRRRHSLEAARLHHLRMNMMMSLRRKKKLQPQVSGGACGTGCSLESLSASVSLMAVMLFFVAVAGCALWVSPRVRWLLFAALPACRPSCIAEGTSSLQLRGATSVQAEFLQVLF